MLAARNSVEETSREERKMTASLSIMKENEGAKPSNVKGVNAWREENAAIEALQASATA